MISTSRKTPAARTAAVPPAAPRNSGSASHLSGVPAVSGPLFPFRRTRSLSLAWPLLAVLAALFSAPPARAQNGKIAVAPPADYLNKFEAYGGIGFMNGQAGQNLPKRYNMGTAEGMFTYWLTPRLGLAGDYRFAGGTTPVTSPYFNRVAIYQHIGMGGVQWRGPKNRYAAIDYHGLAGVSHGIFDQAITNYGGAGSPVTATQVGLYTNRTSFNAALGGSVDFNYSRSIAIRLQPDLILEHFGTDLREYFAISVGVVYRFGHR